LYISSVRRAERRFQQENSLSWSSKVRAGNHKTFYNQKLLPWKNGCFISTRRTGQPIFNHCQKTEVFCEKSKSIVSLISSYKKSDNFLSTNNSLYTRLYSCFPFPKFSSFTQNQLQNRWSPVWIDISCYLLHGGYLSLLQNSQPKRKRWTYDIFLHDLLRWIKKYFLH
jgi:hypothetical protein